MLKIPPPGIVDPFDAFPLMVLGGVVGLGIAVVVAGVGQLGNPMVVQGLKNQVNQGLASVGAMRIP